jgi:hypothetical protein
VFVHVLSEESHGLESGVRYGINLLRFDGSECAAFWGFLVLTPVAVWLVYVWVYGKEELEYRSEMRSIETLAAATMPDWRRAKAITAIRLLKP